MFMELYRKVLMGIVIYVVIQIGMTYFLQEYLIVARAYGSIVHFSVIIIFIPLIIGCLLRILQTPKVNIVIFLGAFISAVILYFYYKYAWEVSPHILQALSFLFIAGTTAYLGTVIPIPKKPRKDKNNISFHKINKKIFISYRRIESATIVGRIYDRLVSCFGKEFVYKDVDDVPPGVDFRKHLIQSLLDSGVLLIVIGKDWLTVSDQNGDPRLNDPHDYIRIEIETAIENRLKIVPVLVNDSVMPKPDQLPLSISDIAYIQAATIREDPDFNTDVNRLISKTSEILSN